MITNGMQLGDYRPDASDEEVDMGALAFGLLEGSAVETVSESGSGSEPESKSGSESGSEAELELKLEPEPEVNVAAPLLKTVDQTLP